MRTAFFIRLLSGGCHHGGTGQGSGGKVLPRFTQHFLGASGALAALRGDAKVLSKLAHIANTVVAHETMNI